MLSWQCFRALRPEFVNAIPDFIGTNRTKQGGASQSENGTCNRKVNSRTNKEGKTRPLTIPPQ